MIAYVDMFSGISGDMMLGALIDLGVPVDWLTQKLSRVLTGFELEARPVSPHHINATSLFVKVSSNPGLSRNYRDIRTLIEKAPLSETVQNRSLSAFKKIAEAESGIHGHDIETIHFHEVGGVDSLVDIIGSFLCVDYLGIETVHASVIPLGSGTVTCSHGTIPVPVPATLAILKDLPVKPSDARTEIVTPTGAAIISTLARGFGPMPEMQISRIGYGAGKRETGSALPNLLRIVLGEAPDAPEAHACAVQREIIHVVKTNIDDMNPEIAGFLMDALFENKALDVCYVPVHMKKNRPGTQVQVMCRQVDLDRIICLILTQTSSIGVRTHACDRYFLSRETVTRMTAFGELPVKKIINPDQSVRYVPEFEAARKVARERNMPLKDVYARIVTDANALDMGCGRL